ncbi:MAG: VCBS repeat-containing protein [Proteobacteria bacterium]|nr:VCBS repeat-containing protein [Pseudomonadota bacterium]
MHRPSLRTLLCTSLLATGCAGGGDGPGSDSGSDPGPTACASAPSFRDGLQVPIPAGGFPMASDADHCNYTGNRTDRTYVLTDLDGDDLPDLVVTGDCSGDATIGTARWDVYKNQGSAFATSATSFAIPAGGFPMASDADHCNYTGNRTDRTYSLTDIDGDDLPDLVVTGDCGGDATIGTTHWDVYKNQGGAFASTATSYTIPAGGFPMASDADHCNYTGNRTNRTYSLTDLDGDDLPDLVVTGDCGGDATIGTTHWDVYKNQGSGFATTATSYAIPAGGFPMVSDADHCNYTGNRTNRTYNLTDIDGDDLPDLVVTADCSGDATIGDTHWDVYKNQGGGFATTATSYAIPAGGFPMASDFDHCNYTGNRTGRTYNLTDVNGDERPDLVVTAECSGDTNVGTTHWKVYENQDSGFAATAADLALPAGGFPMASDFDHCNYTGNRTDRTYSLNDINGDGLPDLVVTGDCNGDQAIGSSHWTVYPLECGE